MEINQTASKPKIISFKWIVTTLLVLVATYIMIRLGFWQLDRLDKRREFNSRVTAQINQQPLLLNEVIVQGDSNALENLVGMEYRKIKVTGKYDFDFEVALRNQAFENQYGVHLLTPLKIEGTNQWIIIDRGWIPGSDFDAGKVDGKWSQFQENGTVTVDGIIRNSQEKPDFGNISDPEPIPGAERVFAWNLANLDMMQKQLPFSVLPVYIQQSPLSTWTGFPKRSEPDLELTEGPHLGYAIQWFTFATILFLGYPVFVYREEYGRAVINKTTDNEPEDGE